jgi:hypothetical protein
VPVGLIIYKSYNIVIALQKWHFIASLLENCSLPKIWRGRRDANMTGGGGGAPRKRLAAT